MSIMSNGRKSEVLDEQVYWRALLTDVLPGWRVFGWDYKRECTYIAPSGAHHEITGELRDALVASYDKLLPG